MRWRTLATGTKIITSFEMYSVSLDPRKVPLAQVLRSGPGDTNMIGSVKVRNVTSGHGLGISEKTDGGQAMGFFITFANGLTVYFAGSTDTTLDMTMWGRKFKPDVAILCLSNGRDPEDLVEQARLLRTDNPNLHTVIPHHLRIPQRRAQRRQLMWRLPSRHRACRSRSSSRNSTRSMIYRSHSVSLPSIALHAGHQG